MTAFEFLAKIRATGGDLAVVDGYIEGHAPPSEHRIVWLNRHTIADALLAGVDSVLPYGVGDAAVVEAAGVVAGAVAVGLVGAR
jgi:hypothetical protein